MSCKIKIKTEKCRSSTVMKSLNKDLVQLITFKSLIKVNLYAV